MKFNIFKRTVPVLVAVLLSTSCQEFKLGDAFLAKAPAGDLNIDDIYSSAAYARRALWAAYQTLPYGFNMDGRVKMGNDVLECITDLNHSNYGYADAGSTRYYTGNITSDTENGGWSTKYSYGGGDGEMNWTGIRRAWLFIQNVDRVPDMDEAEKTRLKAEAKMIVAIHYSDMFRHFGGLPWLDQAFEVGETLERERETALQTLDNIVALFDEAAADLPWTLAANEQETWNGRLTKAAALGLKARILLFGASPLFNSATPYLDGEASQKHLTWYGSYMPELWQRALTAHEQFFTELERNGVYSLVTGGDNPRMTWRNAYLERNNGECIVSTRTSQAVFHGYWVVWPEAFFETSGDYGCTGPTQEWVDMYPMTNGKYIHEPDSGWDPDFPYQNRDPRMYESICTNGDVYWTTKKVEVWVADEARGVGVGIHNQKYASYGPWKTGYRLRKFLLDGGGATQFERSEMVGKFLHFPYLRLPELYYGYAEALCQTGGDMGKAYELANAMRTRVGIGGLTPGLTGDDFIAALLTERVCELAFEEVRWFDMIRYKREDIFKKRLHGVELSVKDPTENPYVSFDYTFPELPERYWAANFSPKWYLSAFPSNEINKGYGLIQNPGW